MRKRYVAFMFGVTIALGCSMLSGCSDSEDEAKDDEGTVLEEGTPTDMPQGGGQQSALELTGEEKEITIDDDGNAEEIVVMTMGGGPEQSGGIESYNSVEEYTEDTEKPSQLIGGKDGKSEK